MSSSFAVFGVVLFAVFEPHRRVPSVSAFGVFGYHSKSSGYVGSYLVPWYLFFVLIDGPTIYDTCVTYYY